MKAHTVSNNDLLQSSRFDQIAKQDKKKKKLFGTKILPYRLSNDNVYEPQQSEATRHRNKTQDAEPRSSNNTVVSR